MRIGILGTGGVGRTLAGALSERGHDVVMGSRDPEAALASTDVNQQTDTTLSGWHDSNAAVRVATFAEAAAHGEVLMLATAGDGSLAATAAAGDDLLDGKVLIDISNPLSWSDQGPSLTVMNTDSLAEQVQRQHPGARVVKALNTVTASLMVDPATLAGGDHTLPICGNDDDAKQQVTRWLGEWFGWRDVLDLGDLSGARATEAYLLFWIRLYQATGSPIVNTKIIR
jgi:8-hydroxy-5-deazaflavin:NADPH oxidoreductase